MPRAKQPSDLAVYQLKVTLRDSKPPIWRRIQVTSDTRLSTLHRVLQVVMGWEGAHLHQFMAHGMYYGTPHPDFGFEVKNEQHVSLHQVVSRVKDKLIYEYDFGDSWEHELLIEKILPPEAGKRYPVPHRQTRLSARGLRWYLGLRELSGGYPRSAAPRA